MKLAAPLLGAVVLLAGVQTGMAKAPAVPTKPQLHGIQYLYGSAEGAAISRQAWAALTDYVALHLRDGTSVVLAEGAALDAPRFVSCDGRPPAAVFDVDETVLLNLGFESDDLTRSGEEPFDDDRWDRWEKTGAAKVVPVPGAREGIDRLRALGVTVIFNTNRSAANAPKTEQALDGAGLGPAVHGQTLFLAGDDKAGSHKDGRRALIASRYCVVAMGGDQLTDFTDLFRDTSDVAARRGWTALPGIVGLWGRGWFVLPNPAYGAGLNGGANDIFPAGMQWHDPADASHKEPR